MGVDETYLLLLVCVCLLVCFGLGAVWLWLCRVLPRLVCGLASALGAGVSVCVAVGLPCLPCASVRGPCGCGSNILWGRRYACGVSG